MIEVMKILEGICPDCEGDARIIRVAGTQEFHDEYTFRGDHEIDLWRDSSDATIGEVEVECAQGHKNSAWANRYGDWS